MVYLTSDHAGYKAKQAILAYLKKNNYDVTDLGPDEYVKDDDYPDYSFKLGETVAKNKARGIIVCGSGIGVTVAANKVKGVRAGYIESEEHAILSRTDDDTNILVLDAITFDSEKDFPIIATWLNTKFSEAERHKRRIKKIEEYENKGITI